MNRSWGVAIERFQEMGQCLSIYSIYVRLPYPELLSPGICEAHLSLYPDREPLGAAEECDTWINEVRNPERWRCSDQEFEIEADYTPPGDR